MAGADLFALALSGSRDDFRKSCLKRRAWGNMRTVFRPSAAILPFISFRRVNSGRSCSRRRRRFQWGLKVPEQVTVPRWPTHPRYGALAGQDNPLFLDWDLFESSFLRALEPYREQVGVLIFEFGTFRRRAIRRRGKLS